jgi:O-acetyl-ADP-ribose deacetylase (regulator of RNase III)
MLALMQASPQTHWKNSSIAAFAGGLDPVEKMMQVASSVALQAIQCGWEGPPFDPFRLADYLRIKVVAREDVVDARTVPAGAEKFRIEYNPNVPKPRVRYSIAHEIAHTFFPDCSDRVRYRASREDMPPEDWQIELLCNIGAAELMMPTGSLPDLRGKVLGMDEFLLLRKKYEVSVESLALRYIKVTERPVAVFVASRKHNSSAERYHIDYAISSRSWPIRLKAGTPLPQETVINDCTAIGFTARGQEDWPQIGKVGVEAVGIPPYPTSIFPRVVGFLNPKTTPLEHSLRVQHVNGDATQFRGSGKRILAHVVNDKTPNWGAGFGRVVRETWPPIQEEFRSWTLKDRSNLELGNVFICKISDDVFVMPMICQHGYGPSERPRIRYVALKECLQKIQQQALELKASVHMPRIGSGYGGGSWGLIEQLIDENLCRFGIPVTVYSLPNEDAESKERDLFSR